MTTLSRLTGKVFAGNAELENLGIFGSAKSQDPTNPTGTNTEAQIQSLPAYNKGWTDGVVTTKNFPPIEEVSGVLRTISYQACYLLQEGVPTYDADTYYSATSIVKSLTGNVLTFYVSQHDDNKGYSLTDTEHWQPAVYKSNNNVGDLLFSLNFSAPDPNKYIELRGQAVSRDQYSELYAVFTTTYNTGGEAAGEFRLPDFTDRTIWGGTTAGVIAASIPSITASCGYAGGHYHGISSSGAHTHKTDEKGNHRHKTKETTDNDDIGGYLTSGTKGDGGAAIYTDYAGDHSHNISSSGAHTHTTNPVDDHKHTISLSPSKSGIYKSTATTVQPPAIKVRVYARYEL